MVLASAPVLIVLAAGSGSRFGGSIHKLAQPLGGSTVLGTTLAQALASHLPVLVVTTEALFERVTPIVAARDIVVLPRVGSTHAMPLGMGFSIAAGVAARPQAHGWIMLPGDMPMVRPGTLAAVAQALCHHPVAYAQHRGQRGHPVGFGAELYSELVTLHGDEGARRLVARYPAHGVDIDDPGVLLDVDTEDDLRVLRSVHASRLREAQA